MTGAAGLRVERRGRGACAVRSPVSWSASVWLGLTMGCSASSSGASGLAGPGSTTMVMPRAPPSERPR